MQGFDDNCYRLFSFFSISLYLFYNNKVSYRNTKSLVTHLYNLLAISSMISSVFALPPRSGDNSLPSSRQASTAA